MSTFWQKRLSPFKYANYRNFYFGQLFSLVGTWSHELARSWLVLEIAGTATALGTLLLSLALPGILFTIYGGTIADRKDALRVVLATKSALSLAALTFAFLTEFGHVQLWMIFVFGLFEGIVNSFDGPAFTSVFSRLIPREEFQQALALQSMNFHLARMLGPAVAGLLMVWHGPSLVFLFDSISYLVVLYVLKKVHLRPREERAPNGSVAESKKSILDEVHDVPSGYNLGKESKESKVEHGHSHSVWKLRFSSLLETLKGFGYFYRNPISRYKQMQFIITMGLIMPLSFLVFRSYLKTKFNLSADEFGFLFASPSIGAIGGALYITLVARKDPIRNLLFGVPIMILGLLVVSHAPTPHLAALVLCFCGFFQYINIASVTQSMQIDTPDAYRGRLGSIITLGFGSLAPLMSFPIGIYADVMGFEPTIKHLTILYALLSFILAAFNFRARPADILGSS